MSRLRVRFALAILSLPVFAQSPPTISVNTRLVQFSVVAHDKHGNPVADLTKDDFEIKDNGQLRPISVFVVENSTSSSQSPQPPALPANVVRNRPTRSGTAPRNITVVLLDAYSTKVTDQMNMRQQMMRFFEEIYPGDRIALYALTGGVSSGFRVLHDFTDNTHDLMEAVEKLMSSFSSATEASDPVGANTGDDMMDSALDRAAYIDANFYTRMRAVNTSAAFIALAEHLNAIPGRKNVVWVSGGFPIDIGFGDPEDTKAEKQAMGGMANDQQIFTDYIQRASLELNRANVSVYPVDVRGLKTLGMADASRNFKINRQTHQLPQSATRVDQRPVDTMKYIADLTGGRAYYDRNDIDRAVRDAMDDSVVTYLIGYYLPEDSWDNRFHNIKVSVKRSGVHIRTKKGYLAQDLPAPNDKQADDLLRQALWSPLDSAALSLTARTDASNTKPGATVFTYILDLSELRLKEHDGKYEGKLDVVFAQENKRGQILASVRKQLTLGLHPDTYQTLLQRGLGLSQEVELNPAAGAVRIIVLNRADGSTGSVTVPISGNP
ncbi:MAG TPA: VWA domain-containing protein [Bryobacteraceae bacterium]|jgi:VWFA-related protein|nr:VWA domain-containing protein [Bryobacteraceae bacterium]